MRPHRHHQQHRLTKRTRAPALHYKQAQNNTTVRDKGAGIMAKPVWRADLHPKDKTNGQFITADNQRGLPVGKRITIPYGDDDETTGISPQLTDALKTPAEWTGQAVHVEYEDGNAEDTFCTTWRDKKVVNGDGDDIISFDHDGNPQPAEGVKSIIPSDQYEATDLALTRPTRRYSENVLSNITDPDAIGLAMRSDNPTMARALASNPNLYPPQLEEIAVRWQDDTTATTRVRSAILANPQVTQDEDLYETAMGWYYDAEGDKRAKYAEAYSSNPNASVYELSELARSNTGTGTLRNVANHPHSNDAVLSDVVRETHNEEIKLDALHNPNSSSRTVQAVYKTSVDPYTRAEALKHPGCPDELMRSAIENKDSQWVERASVINNPSAPEDVLRDMAEHDEDAQIRVNAEKRLVQEGRNDRRVADRTFGHRRA